MKKIYSLFILMAFMIAGSATAWAQCEGEATCTITISGTDQYSDGWNGAAITIYQDTIFIGTYSCAGASSVATFHVCQGPVSFSWSSGSLRSSKLMRRPFALPLHNGCRPFYAQSAPSVTHCRRRALRDGIVGFA
jgi:hypothetical protein